MPEKTQQYDDWAESTTMDEERQSKRKGKSFGRMFFLTEHPTRIRFWAPEEPYIHPLSKLRHPFYAGYRYYVKGIGNVGANGKYFYTDGKTVIEAWRNPKKFGLDVAPLAKFQKLGEPDPFYAFEVRVEEYFHVVEEQGRDGRTYNDRKLCTGPGCEHCRTRKPKSFGKKAFMVFSPSQWEYIKLLNEKAHSYCKCGGVIYTPHFECRSCEKILHHYGDLCYSCDSENLSIDLENEEFECEDCNARWPLYPFEKKEFWKEATAKQTCSCGHSAQPKAVRLCVSCGEDYKECNLLDFQVKLWSETAGKSKARVIHYSDMVLSEPDPRLFDPTQVGGDEDKRDSFAEANKKSLDLTQACSPMPNDKMAELLGCANPFDSHMDEGSVPYSHNDDNSSEDEAPLEVGDTEDEEQASVKVRPPQRAGKPAVRKGPYGRR